MEFASVLFIELFLPVVLIVYYLLGFIRNEKVKMTIRNSFLLLASLLFYAFGGINELLIFLALITVNFLAGLALGKVKPEKKGLKKGIFIAALLINVLVLVLFKYLSMFVNMIDMFRTSGSVGAALTGLLRFNGSGFFRLVMPLAISFIIFQSISYITDVFTGKTEYSKIRSRLRFT